MEKGKRYKKEKKNKGQIIYVILMLFFIALFVVASIKIIKYLVDENKTKEIDKEISKLVTIVENEEKNDKDDKEDKKYKIDFDSLKEKNPDTVGYIKVNNTDINFVVVQGEDNSYYLHHNFEKKENLAGWIFVDYRNKLDGTDKNVIIYGHNMKNDTMFGTLKNALNEEWYNNEDNRKITFITENEYSIYDVFSIYQIEAESYYTQTDFNKDNDFKNFLDTLKKRSEHNFDVELNEGNQILTLSTCGTTNKYRMIIHAKKV